jgi:hypothetical protein
MKNNIVLFFLLFYCSSYAQQKSISNNVTKKHGIVLSPLALIEPNATFDIGYIYTLKARKKIFINAGVLLPFNFYKGNLPFNNGGFRIVAQYREYNKNDYFYGFELRYRHVAFDNIGKSFKNTVDNSIVFLNNPNTRADIYAGAFIFGVQEHISKNKKWNIEATIGIGVRFKNVSYKNTKATFIPFENYFERRSWVPVRNENIGTVHMPGTFRLIYVL